MASVSHLPCNSISFVYFGQVAKLSGGSAIACLPCLCHLTLLYTWTSSSTAVSTSLQSVCLSSVQVVLAGKSVCASLCPPVDLHVDEM